MIILVGYSHISGAASHALAHVAHALCWVAKRCALLITGCDDDRAPHADDCVMATSVETTERCAICGEDAKGAKAYCHVYVEGLTHVYCCPACAELALHGNGCLGEAAGRGRSDTIARLVERMRWEQGS